eukprot:gene10270-12022_t
MNTTEKRHGSHHQFITTGGSNNRPKFTTRHLAALGFLSNIPMAKEASIQEAGIKNITRLQAMEEENGPQDDEESLDYDDEEGQNNADQMGDFLTLHTDSVGIKLKGAAAATARYPLQFRYNFHQLSDQSAVVRQWEDQLLLKAGVSAATQQSAPLLSCRVFCSRARSYPNMVFSVIKYDAGEEKAKIQKLIAEDHKGLEVFELPRRDWRGFSYRTLFKTVSEEKAGDPFFEKGYLYDPNFIDDPSMLHGSHRYVLQRKESTGPIISSIIHFVNKQDLKLSLNEKFRERHPSLPPSLTLSKIRNLKKVALLTCLSIGIEISTVAMAMINFERLCMKSIVTKYNRRLTMAVSLVLAVKFNETVYDNYHSMLNALLSFFDREWDLPKKEVFEAEFGAFVHLGFTMHIPFPHVYLMYSRLLKLLNQTSKQYLGETMNDIYVQDIIAQERQRQQTRQAQLERERERRNSIEGRPRGGSVESVPNAHTHVAATVSTEETSRKVKSGKPFKLNIAQVVSTIAAMPASVPALLPVTLPSSLSVTQPAPVPVLDITELAPAVLEEPNDPATEEITSNDQEEDIREIVDENEEYSDQEKEREKEAATRELLRRPSTNFGASLMEKFSFFESR